MANKAAKANPTLFHSRYLATPATASTRFALPASRGSRPGDTGSCVIASPQTMRRAWTSPRRATYKVRPATLMWLGAGWPRAAATNDGADIDEPDRTAQ